MGCFNVSCGISGISMYSDAMVLLPLIPVRHPAPLTSAHLVTNDPACVLFEPFCLPLFGRHDTYGRLVDIVPDWHTARIESVFCMSIHAFMEHFVTFHEEEKQPTLPQTACGMYVHQRIWDVFSKPTWDEWGQPQPPRKPGVDWYARWCLRNPDTWLRLYQSDAHTPQFRALLMDLCLVLANMAACNKLLMPTINGYQHGNYYVERLLHETALVLIAEHIAEMEVHHAY